MTDDFSGLNVLKLSVFLVTVLHGSSLTMVNADVATASVTEYHVTVPSEAFSRPSLITATRHEQMDGKVQQSSENYDTSAVINLVEAPVEVIGLRVVDSGTPGKVEKKRESGISDLGYKNGRSGCLRRDDGEPKGDSYEVNHSKTKNDVPGVVRASAKRDAPSRMSCDREDGEYDNEESDGSEMMGDEHENDNYEDDADDVVVDDEKKRRNLRRKSTPSRIQLVYKYRGARFFKRFTYEFYLLAIAGRRYRQGPKIWDQWGKWTSCSVSCGAGKLTRWRHCVAGGCSLGEKEAQLKTCTFSAC